MSSCKLILCLAIASSVMAAALPIASQRNTLSELSDNLTAALNVMRAVTTPAQLGFLPRFRNPGLDMQLGRVCQVLDFTATVLAEAESDNSTSAEQSSLIAEAIQNNTCIWVQERASNVGIENCSPQELRLFCSRVRLFLHTTAADESLPVSSLGKCDWVSARFTGELLEAVSDATRC